MVERPNILVYNTYNESRLNEENQSFPELIFGDKSVLVK
jgi:hypothetical protein